MRQPVDSETSSQSAVKSEIDRVAVARSNRVMYPRLIVGPATADGRGAGRRRFLAQALESSVLLVLEDKDACLRACDILAPEHLHLVLADAVECKDRLSHYGGLL